MEVLTNKTESEFAMRITAAIFMGFFLLAGPIAAEPFKEGEHYQRIGTPVSVPDDRVEVIEAFAYPCPACRNFLSHITSWEADKPDYVSFDRLPVGLQPGWDLFARAYYTAQVMGIGDETHEAMFRALHDERRQFGNFDDIAAFYADQGVSKESFLNTSQSFAVDARMRQNRNDVRRFGVRGTPSVIVQGKWRISPNSFGSYGQMVEAIEYLVALEAKSIGLGGDNGEPAQEADDADEESAAASE